MLLRPAVERKLRGFIDRIRQVNHEEQFVFRVAKAVVFGSYLSAKARISDIDIAILLEPRRRIRKSGKSSRPRESRRHRKPGGPFITSWIRSIGPKKKYFSSSSRGHVRSVFIQWKS